MGIVGEITVGGFVEKPGPLGCRKGWTVWQAIQGAGGANEFGSLKRVQLIRDGRLRRIDLTDKEAAPILVQPNDMIEVPQKNFIGR
jgi:protein involved in polysaccharide export with SLBB domain